MFTRMVGLSSLLGLIGLTAHASDWPQWLGANRDGSVSGFVAPKTWPKELKKQWSVKVGDGVATPALVGDKLYVFSFTNDSEILRCLNAETGKEIWQDKYSARAAGGPARGFPGARSSPAVADGKVVTMGVQGTLSCLDAETGKVVWRKESTGTVPGFATSSSPILVEGLCIVQTGGDRSGSVVAFDLASGDEKWKWTGDGTKYASPNLLIVDDVKAVVVETAGTISAVNLADGKLLWQTPFNTRYNASSPFVEGQVVYFGGSSRPTQAVKMEKDGDKLVGKQLWSNRDNSVIYNTPVVKEGILYGLSERNELFSIDTESGTTLWSEPLRSGGAAAGGAPPRPGAPGAPGTRPGRPGRPGGFGGAGGGRGGGGRAGYGNIVTTDSVLFALTPSAQLVVFQPDREEFKEVASYKVGEAETYGFPLISNNRIIVKDKDSVTVWTLE